MLSINKEPEAETEAKKAKLTALELLVAKREKREMIEMIETDSLATKDQARYQKSSKQTLRLKKFNNSALHINQ